MNDAVIVDACRSPVSALRRSGARILTTLLHEMRLRASGQSQPFYRLVSLCVGAGQGELAVLGWVL